jgi:four helix bundle protein
MSDKVYRKYDLEERIAAFCENVNKFCKKNPNNSITNNLISQLIKSSTSVDSNYSKADNADSKKDFRHKIGIVKKESRESIHLI